MKQIVLLLFLAFSVINYGQDIKHDTIAGSYKLFQKKGKWGVVKGEAVLLKANYNHIRIEPNKTFTVIIKDKAGVLDSLGNTLIPCKYDGIQYLFDDIYTMQTGKKWGVVNQLHKEILPVIYDRIDKAADGLGAASVYTGHFDLPTGLPRFKMSYDFFLFNKSGLIDGTAYHRSIVIEGMTFYSDRFNLYNYLQSGFGFSEGVAAINSPSNAVFIDPSGHRVFGKTFDYTANFKDGYAIIGIADKSTGLGIVLPPYYDMDHSCLYGMIGRDGREIIPCIYEKLGSYNDYNQYKYTTEFIPARLHGKWGAINIQQEVIIPFEYDLIEIEGDLVIIMSGNKLGLADVSGNLLTSLNYDDIQISGDKILVKEGGKYFLIDRTGKRVN